MNIFACVIRAWRRWIRQQSFVRPDRRPKVLGWFPLEDKVAPGDAFFSTALPSFAAMSVGAAAQMQLGLGGAASWVALGETVDEPYQAPESVTFPPPPPPESWILYTTFMVENAASFTSLDPAITSENLGIWLADNGIVTPFDPTSPPPPTSPPIGNGMGDGSSTGSSGGSTGTPPGMPMMPPPPPPTGSLPPMGGFTPTGSGDGGGSSGGGMGGDLPPMGGTGGGTGGGTTGGDDAAMGIGQPFEIPDEAKTLSI